MQRSGDIVVEKAKLKYDGVVFIGHMASGKSYCLERASEILKEKYGIILNRVSIASGIKEIATNYFGMKEKDRRLLQNIGSKMREIDPDVWIKATMIKIENQNLIPFVLDDMRFINEENNIRKKYSIFVVKLEPNENERLKVYKKLYGRFPTKEELSDPTEIEINKLNYDYLIKNNYDKDYVEKEINNIINKIINKE